MAPPLSPETRAATLARLPAERLDLLVVGGGITGAGIARDAALRGLVLATVKGAHAAGARCVNHVAVTALDPGSAETVLRLHDGLGGADYRMSARVVVNAAGPWVDEVRALAGARGGPRLHLTKGIHLVVPHARLPVRHAVVMQARDRRSVFAVPRDGATYIGTTDTDHGPPVDHPEVTAGDVDYLLDAANRCFTGPPLAPTDVTGTWAGLRPLLHEEGKRPSEISRKDEIMVDAATGLVSIAGGKLTTYRRMAERVVDLVCERLGHRAPCRTDGVPLPGGERLPEEVARQLPALPAGAAERLVRLYGAEAKTIAARGGETVPGLPIVLRGEVEHVLDAEMTLTLEDLLERRTRLLLFDPHQGLDGLETVASMAAARLGWTSARTAAEIDAYRALAASWRMS